MAMKSLPHTWCIDNISTTFNAAYVLHTRLEHIIIPEKFRITHYIIMRDDNIHISDTIDLLLFNVSTPKITIANTISLVCKDSTAGGFTSPLEANAGDYVLLFVKSNENAANHIRIFLYGYSNQ